MKRIIDIPELGFNTCKLWVKNKVASWEDEIIAKSTPYEERPKGHWIKEDDEHLKGWYRCSECGRRVEDLTDNIVIHAGCEDYTVADIYPYCHCGAKMKEGGAEND